jgi:hypothetical protein
MFNLNVYTTIPTKYLLTILKTTKADQFVIEDELYRRRTLRENA